MPTHLAGLYSELCYLVHIPTSTGDIATYLQTHYDMPRPQARRFARILWGWIWLGYVPARHARTATNGPTPNDTRRARVKAHYARIEQLHAELAAIRAG